MPNWCLNRLQVRGPLEGLASLRASVASRDDGGRLVALDFERVLPIPAELRDSISPAPTELRRLPPETELDPSWGAGRLGVELNRLLVDQDASWYAWALVNWGTKWNLDAETRVRMDRRRRVLTYDFSSANNPPIAFVAALSEAFPELRFELLYAEPGNWYGGRTVLVNGRFESDECLDGDRAKALLRSRRWSGWYCFE